MRSAILVVEDNEANLSLMLYLLRATGYEPAAARNGEEALCLAAETQFDLILCDVQMPKVDGFEVLRRLKADARYAAVPVVAVTALAMVGDKDRMLAAGFDGYIGKPIAPRTFVDQIKKFLPGGEAGTEREQPAPLPRTQPAASPQTATPWRETILVVDDVPANRSLLEQTLRPHGYAVVCVSNVPDALAYLNKKRPSLVLSDLHIKKGSGFDLLRAVRSDPALATIPFLLLSATIFGSREVKEGLALGADDFLLRPVSPAALLKRIRALLDRKTA